MLSPSTLAGYILFLMIVLSSLYGLFGIGSLLLIGLLGWTALLLRIKHLPKLQLRQAIIIAVVGIIGLAIGFIYGTTTFLLPALHANQAMITMLCAITFLRLVSRPRLKAQENLPQGRRALWQTLFGVHLFGAVINLSVLAIMSERIAQQQKLTLLQGVILIRGFALAAVWSPFFVAMGMMLVYVPDINVLVVSLTGIPIALVTLWLTGVERQQQAEEDDFLGYPLHWNALLVPLILAVVVLTSHQLFPHLSIIALISVFAVLLSALLLLWRNGNLRIFHQHIRDGLPNMIGELALFSAAGIMAMGMNTLVHVFTIQLPFSHFGIVEAALTIATLNLLAVLGVHPIISIASFSSLLVPLADNPNLLANSFLVVWSMAIFISPFSAVHLFFQGRFHLLSYRMALQNVGLALKMYGVALLILWIVDYWSAKW